MKMNKFKMLGVTTVLVAAGFNVQHAEAAQYGTPVQQEQKAEKAEKLTIFNLMAKVIKKEDPEATQDSNKEKAKNITEQSKEFMNTKTTHGYGSNVDDNDPGSVLLPPNQKVKTKANKKNEVEVIEKGSVLLNPNEHPKREEVSNNEEPSQPGNILLKAWEGTKNVASNVAEKGKESFLAAKAKADAENEKRQAQPKVVQAEGPFTAEDVVKAKDKVVGGISNLLGKLRSEPQSENTNKVKPN